MNCQDVPQLLRGENLQSANSGQVGPNKRLQPPFGALGGLSNRSPRRTWTPLGPQNWPPSATWPPTCPPNQPPSATWRLLGRFWVPSQP